MTAPPDGFKPAKFSSGFLDVSGPYFLRSQDQGTIVAMRILETHANYLGVAHGGVLSTFADVALSFQVHDSERPALSVVTNTLTTNFLAGAKTGDWLEAYCRIDRLGKRIAYASGEIRKGDALIMTMSGVFTILRQS
ncbi:MAG: PaaI family thioesterase [Sphingomonadales bacterium]|jgi:acyl-coenzyme A thioesterase 13|nr:PaaI family thioesterase [Sphingomonadales bacterium]MBK6490661.1 PaaI family thioesterase [Sphingomonadales bacterium]MBK6719386.1 PaaI family thioesterase [Sphingomonadales bacterium]MBK8859438.1 PaaI family thioesterase [Sphingomonadales bacterium]MBL0115756.1 PaaI family thioesterase [Sphingomonadales bacterium]